MIIFLIWLVSACVSFCLLRMDWSATFNNFNGFPYELCVMFVAFGPLGVIMSVGVCVFSSIPRRFKARVFI